MSDLLRRASWLSRAASSDRYSDSSHELPRWRSPSPMAASLIPPPIIQSTYMSPPSSKSVTKSTFFEQPAVTDTREEDLHADLQFLLDAQAAALARGLDGGSIKDGGSTGSTTPTASSTIGTITRVGSRQGQKKLSLRSARKGLYSTILALSKIKDEEVQSIDAEAERNERNLRQIDKWDTKRKGLEEASSAIDTSEDTVRVQRLRQEADTLQEGINEVEMQLADMKSKHRKLSRQIAAAENSMQAQLSSYTQSMKMLEADVQKFLSLQAPASPGRIEASDGHLSVWQLPAKRRTLEMAKEYFTEQRDNVLDRRRKEGQEKEALVLGGLMWKDVAAAVTEFEKKVRAEMPGADMANSGYAWDDTPQTTPTERLRDLLAEMDAVIGNLENKLHTAEERNWRLLIAAIGAELDALKQGKQILQGVLGEPATDAVSNDGEAAVAETDSGDEIRELDKSFETARRRRPSNGDTDDEPDPELLFSRQDTDTE